LTVAVRGVVPTTSTDADVGDTDTVVTTGSGAGVASVDAATRLESSPNTASPFIVPRNAIAWKL
jgi:hypothetical protein